MTLFDEFTRTERRFKFDLESEFEYHNISARPGVEAFRKVAEQWFRSYPDQHKRDLRARFRSKSPSDHFGAFFELYLHQLLLSMNCEVQIHPQLISSSARPDFVVQDAKGQRFYVEAVLAHCPSKEKEAAGRRTAVVYDCLNDMNCPDYFLGIHINGAPRSSPSASRLRRDLGEWLASLNFDDIVVKYQSGKRNEVPRFEWTHDGWILEIEPIPKSPASRGRSGIRPIGTRVGEARWMDASKEIRSAVRTKAKKYGRLDLPLLVSVNVLDVSDRTDAFDALLGQEETVISFGDDNTVLHQGWTRKNNGVFGSPVTPRNRRVSAVAIVRELTPWTMGAATPELFHHPWAYIAFPQDCWPMPQWVTSHQEQKLEPIHGNSAAALLGLPNPWPISME